MGEGRQSGVPYLAWRALAQERSHTVYAGGAVEASGPRAVVDILRAVVARPPVDADARESSRGVGARRPILNNNQYNSYTLPRVKTTFSNKHVYNTHQIRHYRGIKGHPEPKLGTDGASRIKNGRG